MWRERRWVTLLGLIDQLPATSRLRAAIANDPKAAEAMLDAPQPTEPWSPDLTEWTLLAQLLAEIRDGQGEIIKAVLATIPVDKGKTRKLPKTIPFPRPVTAVDRLRKQLEETDLQDLIAVLTPHARDN